MAMTPQALAQDGTATPTSRVEHAQAVLESAQLARAQVDTKFDKLDALAAGRAEAQAAADQNVADAQAELEAAQAELDAGAPTEAAPTDEPAPEG